MMSVTTYVILRLNQLCRVAPIRVLRIRIWFRVVHGSLFLDPTRPGETLTRPDPTRPDPRFPTKSLTRPDPTHPLIFHKFNIQVANREKYTIVA